MGASSQATMIRWWCKKTKLSMAGVRIRAHLVMRELQRLGYDADWFDPKRPESISTLVLHKRCDAATRATVKQLRAKGVRIIFDHCDNHFYNPKKLPEWDQRARDLKAMLPLADTVVTPTPELAQVLMNETAIRHPPVVIPDACDNLAEIPIPLTKRIWQPIPTRQLVEKINHQSHRLPLLWFGNHGCPFAEGGMLDLLAIREELEQLNSSIPLLLTILSDNRKKYRNHFQNWSFPVYYNTWSAQHFHTIAAAHKIALIPVQNNPYTRVKSENRVVTSFAHGLAVVADPVPSYRNFSDALLFGNWAQSIETYATNADIRKQHINAGRKLASETYGVSNIAQQWSRILGADSTQSPVRNG